MLRIVSDPPPFFFTAAAAGAGWFSLVDVLEKTDHSPQVRIADEFTVFSSHMAPQCLAPCQIMFCLSSNCEIINKSILEYLSIHVDIFC